MTTFGYKPSKTQFAGPWPKACQITSPWTLTRSNILFFYRSQPKQDNFQSKNQHRATAAATVAVVVVAVVAQIVVSCSKNGRARGAVREPPDPEIGPNLCGG